MVKITKEECFALRKLFGDSVSISMTMVGKPKRHKFYAAETDQVMSFLEKYRTENVVEHLEKN